jgi:hypothetical protein
MVGGVHRILEKETTMNVPLDYSERVAALEKARAATPAPVAKQVRPPERTSPTWQKLLTEAQVKFGAGLALSMPDALGQVAKEQPALYEQYRQEQVAQCGANPVEKWVPSATAPVAPPPPTPDQVAKAARAAHDELTYLMKSYMDTHDGALPIEALNAIMADRWRQETLWKAIVAPTRLRKTAPARTMGPEEQAFYDANPHLRRRG